MNKQDIQELIAKELERIRELVAIPDYGPEYDYRIGKVHGLVKALED